MFFFFSVFFTIGANQNTVCIQYVNLQRRSFAVLSVTMANEVQELS